MTYPTQAPAPGQSARPVDVILVHGTYARGTPWTQEGSALRKALSDAFGNIHIETFEWSGVNGHGARLHGGCELAQHLESQAAKRPNARRFVIAHSHGGNVALYAAKGIAHPAQRPDIACLATPFIEPRASGHASRYLRFWLGIALVVAAAWIWFFAAVASRSDGLVAALVLVGPVLIFLVLWGAGVAWWWWAVKRKIRRRIEDLAWPELPSSRLLTLSYTFDEAGVFLRTLGKVSTGAGRRLWRFSGRMLAYGGAWMIGMLTAAAVGPHLVKVLPWLAPLGAEPWPDFAQLVGILLLALGGFSAVLAFGLPLLRGHPWGFGWEEPIDAVFLRAEAVDKPEGLKAAAIDHFRIPIGDFGMGKKMAHTVIYDDPRMQQKIVDWMRAGLAT